MCRAKVGAEVDWRDLDSDLGNLDIHLGNSRCCQVLEACAGGLCGAVALEEQRSDQSVRILYKGWASPASLAIPQTARDERSPPCRAR
jgi:hypothetical protein